MKKNRKIRFILKCHFGFAVVPVKFSEASSACHYLYIKEHVVREANPHKPRERTIFVLNVPPYCTEVWQSVSL